MLFIDHDLTTRLIRAGKHVFLVEQSTQIGGQSFSEAMSGREGSFSLLRYGETETFNLELYFRPSPTPYP